jgi:trypsin
LFQGTYRAVPTTLSIRAGSSDKYSGGQVIGVSAITQHPSYNDYNYNYDFSILRLSTSIILDSTKAIIGLPLAFEAVRVGLVVTATGWGDTQNQAESDRYLRSVDVLTIYQPTCSISWRKLGVVITNQMLCAAAVGKDSCFVSSIDI